MPAQIIAYLKFILLPSLLSGAAESSLQGWQTVSSGSSSWRKRQASPYRQFPFLKKAQGTDRVSPGITSWEKAQWIPLRQDPFMAKKWQTGVVLLEDLCWLVGLDLEELLLVSVECSANSWYPEKYKRRLWLFSLIRSRIVLDDPRRQQIIIMPHLSMESIASRENPPGLVPCRESSSLQPFGGFLESQMP